MNQHGVRLSSICNKYCRCNVILCFSEPKWSQITLHYGIHQQKQSYLLFAPVAFPPRILNPPVLLGAAWDKICREDADDFGTVLRDWDVDLGAANGIIFLGALEGVFARGDVLSMISIMLRTKIESDTMMVCLFA